MFEILKNKKMLFVSDAFIWLLAHSTPLFIGIIINEAVKGEMELVVASVALCTLFVIRIILIYIGAHVDYKLKQKIQRQLYTNISISLSENDLKYESVMESIQTDVEAISYFYMNSIDSLTQVVITCIMLIYLGIQNLYVPVVIVLQVIIVTFVSVKLKNKLKHLRKKMSDLENDLAQEYGMFQKAVYAYKSDFHFYDALFENIQQTAMQQVTLKSLLAFFSKYSIYVFVIIFYFVNMIFGLNVKLNVFLLLMVYIPSFNDLNVYVMNYFIVMQEYIVAVERVENLFGLSTLSKENKFSFSLKTVTSSIKDSSIVGVYGRNGSGKSQYIEAHYLFGNDTIVINYNSKLFHASIIENIVCIGELNEEILRRMNLDKIDLSRDVKTLSGGEKDRVLLARALHSNCSLIVIDGLFKGIDKETLSNIMDALQKSSKKFIIVTNEKSILKKCTRVYKFDNGQLVEGD